LRFNPKKLKMLKNQKMEKGINVPDFEGELWKLHPLGRLVSNFGRMKMIYKSRNNKSNKISSS
jgi:hypothetical protein